MTLEKIIWRDINSKSQWISSQEAVDWATAVFAADFITVGYVIYENDSFVVSAATLDTTHSDTLFFNDISMIPKVVIKSREILLTSTSSTQAS